MRWKEPIRKTTLFCGKYQSGYIALGNAFRHGYPCKQNRLRLTSAPHLHCYAIQRWVRILSYLCQKERNLNRTVFDLGFFWRRKRDSNPRGFWPNGFQDFPRNPTLTQNNRKYQTVENAENPVKSRDFGVLSFQKSKTVDGARISASKRISKDFLEIVLDKSAPTRPVASHILSAKSAATD